MSTTTNVADISVKNRKFSINASELNLEDIKAIQKVLTTRKKELSKPKEIDVQKENRHAIGRDIMNQIMGFNAAFNCICKWRVDDSIKSPERTVTLAELGMENIDRYNYLTKKFANMIVFFPKAQGHISPNKLLDQFAKICKYDDAKFAAMQRAGIEARAKK